MRWEDVASGVRMRDVAICHGSLQTKIISLAAGTVNVKKHPP